jgi:hypothetical protein
LAVPADPHPNHAAIARSGSSERLAAGWEADAMADGSALDDGTYDALVIDAEVGDDGWCRVELTILGGPHKGEVVAVRTDGVEDDRALDLLGIPATLVVADGVPAVTFEP